MSDYTYEAKISLGDGIGHLAAGAVRDGIEDALSGAMEPGEEAYATLESDSEIVLVIKTARELGDVETSTIRDAVAEVLSGAAEEGEAFAVGEILRTETVAPTP